MKRFIFNVCACILLSSPVLAEETAPPPLDFKGFYEFNFAGLVFGRMGIEAEQESNRYAITSDIVSAGILKLFTPHSSHTTADGAGKNFSYPDIVYDTHYQTKKKKKAVKMVYKNGKLIEHDVFPSEAEGKRPAVPSALKNKAHDPLRLTLALRRAIWQALRTGENQFSLTVFDGRRLTQIDATVAGKKTILLGNNNVSTLRLAVRRKILAGFTDSERADVDPKEPTLWMYYSDDERLVPLKVEVGFLFGKLTGTLVKECRTGESCLLGIKE